MDKIDFKKEFKELYRPSSKEVQILNVPKLNYLMIDGSGNPNTSQEYKDSIEALFSVSYTIKFMIKKGINSVDYGVMPLEGLWWTDNMKEFSIENKDVWKWTALIMQPEFVEKDLIDKALSEVEKRRSYLQFPKSDLKLLAKD